MEGRTHNELLKVIRSQEDKWNGVTFLVFDVPNLSSPFEERLDALKALENSSPQLKIARHTLCEGREDLQQKLKAVEALGGEGLWMRKPDSPYTPGESQNMFVAKVNSPLVLLTYCRTIKRHSFGSLKRHHKAFYANSKLTFVCC